MGSRKGDHRGGVLLVLGCHENADCRMRIKEIAGLVEGLADRFRHIFLRGAAGAKFLADFFSAASPIVNEPDCLRLAMAARTSAGSRSFASKMSLSKFDEIWMSIEGEVVALTSRIS